MMVPVTPGIQMGLIGVMLSAVASWAIAMGNEQPENPFANATYFGIEEEPVTLSNGRWEGPLYSEDGASRPSVGLVQEFVLHGDLDGDGVTESVVLLWQSSGGSGTFDHIAVMRETDSAAVNIATAPLGDRVRIRSGELVNGSLQLDVIQQGEDDPACCPSERVLRTWVLDGEALTELNSEYIGSLSAATIEGNEWILTDLGDQEMLDPEINVSLEVGQGQISGVSGCNRYSAAIDNGAVPGEIQIGPAMGTRMACPEAQMKVESVFLERLGQVDQFSFLGGQLILNGMAEDQRFTLRFRSGE